MASTIGAPRLLLRQLRQIMAGKESAQERLSQIVVLIAANMVAEVSSVYRRDGDRSLELIATQGLNPDAVHNTHLAEGEGLVGLIAQTLEPVNLPDAQKHEAFSLRPETGEERYHSFLGVPILRGGDMLGVLTVQNRALRRYSEEEVEALQTTAMVVAELLATGELAPSDAGLKDDQIRPKSVHGVGLFDGVALGHVVLHEPRVEVTKFVADDPVSERRRLDEAMTRLQLSIDQLLARGDVQRAGEHRDVLEAYRMFAHDRGWHRRLREAIATGLTAESAVQRVQGDMRARMNRQRDAFFRERLHDLDDLSNRLLRELTGQVRTAAGLDLADDTILVARTMGPAELLDYDRSKLRALVLEEAGVSSHVTIVARALGLAAVGGAKNILRFAEPGDAIVVDGRSGEVHLRPDNHVVEAYQDRVRFYARRAERYARLRDQPAITRDGEKIDLLVNIGLEVNLPHLAESGADGIGLFRTELQFMVAPNFPRADRQTQMYRKVMERAGDMPVVFRTLDIGGDKVLPYQRQDAEENPAMGWRAIRIALDREGIFRTQLRAFLRAGAGRTLRILLPMISDVGEFEKARRLVDREYEHLIAHGRKPPDEILLGAMIEVPALIWQLDRLLPMTDFVSVGTNDLLQFLFAADRANMRVAHRYDPLNIAILRVLRQIVLSCTEHDVPLTLCGEMASRPLEAMTLIGLGYRALSMAPAAIGPVKAMVLHADRAALQRAILPMLDAGHGDLREQLERLAEAQEIEQ